MTFNGSWLRQPTTMLGLAIIVSALLMAIYGLIPVATFIVVLGPAMGLVIVNDNTGFSKDAQTLLLDGVQSATENHLQANLPKLIQDAMKAASDLTAKTVALLLVLGLTLTLAACAGSTPASNKALFCSVDQSLQPVGASTVEKLIPGATTTLALTIDQLLVHPAIVQYCADMGGTPAAVTPVTPATVPATTMRVRGNLWAFAFAGMRATPWAAATR